jgi:GT2 family glycosyltransferase
VIDGLGVVILGYGRDVKEQVASLVTSLVRQGVGEAAITVVRNPSGVDEPLDLDVQVISPEKNLGYAGGMNLGIREQQKRGMRMVLLLTMDAKLDEGAVARIFEAAQNAPKFGVLGPELRWSAAGRMPAHTSWGVRFRPTGAVEHVLDRPQDTEGNGVVACDAVDGSVVLIRADTLGDTGLLDDRFFMYYEETEFCLRAKRAGWRVGIVLGATAEQASGESRRPGAFNYLMARNGLEFSRLVGGWRGVAAAISRYVAQSWRLLKMRFSPKSDAPRQRYAIDSLGGMWHGVAAYFRHRWGPPPPNLPGIGDITYAG